MTNDKLHLATFEFFTTYNHHYVLTLSPSTELFRVTGLYPIPETHEIREAIDWIIAKIRSQFLRYNGIILKDKWHLPEMFKDVGLQIETNVTRQRQENATNIYNVVCSLGKLTFDNGIITNNIFEDELAEKIELWNSPNININELDFSFDSFLIQQ